MSIRAYNSVTSNRARVAEYIKNTPDALAQFEELGGLVTDLDTIIDQGRAGRDANIGQLIKSSEKTETVVDVGEQFKALQREYTRIMTVLAAVRHDLVKASAGADELVAIDKIIADETPLHIKTLVGEDDKRVKKALKNKTEEAIRIEIERDASALIANAAIAGPLTTRKVAPDRLTKLRDDAAALAGKLDEKKKKKTARKQATAAEHDAVKAQSDQWVASWRIIASIDDEFLQDMLPAASSSK